MAKALSFDDFDADNNLLDNDDDSTQVLPGAEEGEEQEEEEEPVQPVKKVKKEVPKPEPVKVKKVVKAVEPEPEIEPEPVLEEEEEQEDEGVDSQKFFEEVEKITGQSVEVDYSGVDPMTPQGVALREQAVKEAALDGFLEEMKEKHPQAFKALQHAYNGGDIAELFAQTISKDYTKIELKDDDATMAKEILKDYYRARGVKSEVRIQKMLDAVEDSEEGLLSEAQAALDELKGEQEAKTQQVLEVQKQKQAEQKKRDSLLLTAVEDVIERKSLGDFKITDSAEAQKFRQFVVNNIRRGNEGKYEIVTSIDPANMEKLLQYQYFQFKGGDLSKIIQQKATTANVQRLKLKLAGEQDKVKTGRSTSASGKLSLNDFNED